MKHVFSVKPETRRRLGVSGFATVQFPARRQQLRSRRAMDGAINTAAAKQGRIVSSSQLPA
jgi:hypothetical protein